MLNQFFNSFKNALYLPFQSVFGSQEDVFGEKRIYWIFLLSNLALALFVYYKSKRTESINQYIFNKKVWLSKSAMVDYAYIFFNSIVKVFFLSLILNWGRLVSFYVEDFMLTKFEYSTLETPLWVASAMFLIAFTVLEDLTSYLIHYLFHKVPLLWEFHKVHHSATVLNPITQYRIHPVELLFNNLSYLLSFALIHGLFSWLFYNQKEEVTFISTNLFSVLFFLWGANLRHSHVRLSYFSWLENVFLSPYQHQIHHSDNPLHYNKNMGSKLAIWDLIFGTLIKSREASKIRFGINKEENKDFDSFFKTLWRPFLNMFIKKKQ